MNGHRQVLARRREELMARSAAQRDRLIADGGALFSKAAVLDRVVSTVRRHPLATGIALSAVLLSGPRKLLDLAGRLVSLYLLFRQR